MDSTTDTPWLSADQQVSWRDYMVGTTALTDQLDRELRAAHGLSIHEYEILVRLSEAPDRSIRMAELAGSLSHSRSRITHTISRLQRGGLVHRGQCSEDGRGVSAVLTDEGHAALAAAAHTHVRGVHRLMIQNASDDELAVIGRVFARVLATLDQPRLPA
ncbi:MarR family winged helix-turn-helix transcriptional regulator [Aeromicrobium sp. CF3.5]|uniref:MarR family winged helix-turn-helix transcriptional regulator n=1 Tax=Aeromicrobium sp. CF3.5 TaxID=3373078 RepID=UPI003EE69967